MIRRIFHKETKQLSAAAMIIAAASLVSRVVGLFRDRLLAHTFGAGETLDMYYAAFRIPDLVFTLLILGALSAGFIPLFTKMYARDKEEGWQFASDVLTFFLIASTVVSAILIAIAPLLTRFVAPGFSPAEHAETVLLTRIMLLSPIFLGMSSVMGGVLHSFRRFFVTALAPILYNVGIMLGIVFFVPSFGTVGLAFGVVLGALLHVCSQIPVAARLGFSFRLRLQWTPSLTRLAVLSAPRIATLGLAHVVLIALTAFASTMSEGSLAILSFANNLHGVPNGIFGASFAIAAFPAMSQAVAQHEPRRFTQHFSSSVRHVLFFLIPLSALFLVLKAQIVRLVLGSGAFDWADTVATVQALEAFTLSIAAHGLVLVLTRAFWAHEDTLRPAVIAVIGAAVTVVAAWVWKDTLGVRGLALAFSFGIVVQAILLWAVLLRRKIPLDTKRITAATLRMLVAALAMAAVAQWLKTGLGLAFGTETFFTVLLQGVGAGGIGIVLYVGLLSAFGSSEARLLLRKIDRTLRPRLSQTELFEELP